MDKKIKEIEFSKLQHAYVIVKKFLEQETINNVDSLKTSLTNDLSLFGDDNYELLIKFVDKFDIKHKDFKYEDHFHSEYELFGSPAALLNLLSISIWLPIKAIEILTFSKVKADKLAFYIPERNVKDMTFKDLITWYVEKETTMSSAINYKIKTVHNKV